MTRLVSRQRMIFAFGMLFPLIGAACNTALEPVEDSDARAVILGSPQGASKFGVTGKTAEFGRYLAVGELTLVTSGEESAELEGVAALEAENGDQITANVTCTLGGDGIDFTFHWLDSVSFSTGAKASNSGKFVDAKPPGLNVRRSMASFIYGDGWLDPTIPPERRYCCQICCTVPGCASFYTCCFPCGTTGSRIVPATARSHTSKAFNGAELTGDSEQRGLILETPGGVSHFVVTGSNADFGRFIAMGEVSLIPGSEAGVQAEGAGIAALQAENGDQITADATSRVAEDGIDFTFHWRDSVTFSSGAAASSTGEFVDHKPPGLNIARSRSSLWGPINWCCRTCCGDQQCDTMYTCCGPCIITH
jgi:hypothetical protein